MAKKSVGILTHWWGTQNYGQKLQAYALKTYLEKQGFKVTLIRYHKDSKFWHIYLLNRYLHNLLLNLKEKTTGKINHGHRRMDHFTRYYLNPSAIQTSFKHLEKYCKSFDILITGSDQVWASYLLSNPITKKTNINVLNAFTLNIDVPALKLSYAASTSRYYPTFNKSFELSFLDRIKKLSAISVREKALQRYLLSNGIECKLVPDPVFLLNKADYEQLKMEVTTLPTKIKCFQYALMWDDEINYKDIAKHLSTKLNFDFVFVCGVSDEKVVPQTYFPTVQEWLSLIANSNLVITNSFHGIAFCIIMHTNFRYVPLIQDINGPIDDRIETLLSYCGLEDRIVSNLSELDYYLENDPEIDWQEVDQKIQQYRNLGISFLNEALKMG